MREEKRENPSRERRPPHMRGTISPLFRTQTLALPLLLVVCWVSVWTSSDAVISTITPVTWTFVDGKQVFLFAISSLHPLPLFFFFFFFFPLWFEFSRHHIRVSFPQSCSLCSWLFWYCFPCSISENSIPSFFSSSLFLSLHLFPCMGSMWQSGFAGMEKCFRTG